jgi:multiple sugar transport system substrate-binding protein
MGSDAPLIDISEENLVDFEIAVRPVPQFDTENPQMISQGPSMCVFNKENPDEVLVSWLFAQYMLTNDVQIAYSQTEGYVPVTHMAQDSPEYKDYISRMGEDKNLYYYVKIKAAKLLMENTENTFVTPVFNGSADLRSAAGEMIEIAAKSVRRGKTVDEKFVDEVFSEVNALYRLDSISENASLVKNNLGPLPTGSKILIICLCAVWILMGVYVLTARIKRK